MRKQSTETQLRVAKRQVRLLCDEVERMKRKIHYGNLMSNLCFNLSQDQKIEERHRDSMRMCWQGWDKV